MSPGRTNRARPGRPVTRGADVSAGSARAAPRAGTPGTHAMPAAPLELACTGPCDHRPPPRARPAGRRRDPLRRRTCRRPRGWAGGAGGAVDDGPGPVRAARSAPHPSPASSHARAPPRRAGRRASPWVRPAAAPRAVSASVPGKRQPLLSARRRASTGGARWHATQPDLLQRRPRPYPHRRPRRTHVLQPERHVPLDTARDHAGPRVLQDQTQRPGPSAAPSADRHRPDRSPESAVSSSPASARSRVDLPDPTRPGQQHPLPGGDGERDAGDDGLGPPVGAPAEPLDLDPRATVAHRGGAVRYGVLPVLRRRAGPSGRAAS